MLGEIWVGHLPVFKTTNPHETIRFTVMVHLDVVRKHCRCISLHCLLLDSLPWFGSPEYPPEHCVLGPQDGAVGRWNLDGVQEVNRGVPLKEIQEPMPIAPSAVFK